MGCWQMKDSDCKKEWTFIEIHSIMAKCADADFIINLMVGNRVK